MKLIIAMVMLALVSACSSNPVKTHQTSDGGTSIRVTATGSTFEEAKSIAFNRAIEYVVGSVILNEKESKNDKLVRNDILNHSSGYVDNYSVIKSTMTGNSVTLEMDVVVKNSRIANRILNKTTTDTNINGDKLATQYSTYLDSRKSVNSIITPVLADFPNRAFSIKVEKTDFQLDMYNNSRLAVQYRMDWNYNWVMAMDEALKLASSPRDRAIAQEQIKIVRKKPDSWIGSNDTYYYNDAKFYEMVYNKLRPTVSVYAKVKDINGNVIGCQQAHHIGVYTTSTIEIDGAHAFSGALNFTFPPNRLKSIESLSNIETGVTIDLEYCDKR